MLTPLPLWFLLAGLQPVFAEPVDRELSAEEGDDTEDSDPDNAAGVVTDAPFADIPAVTPPPGSLWEWISKMEGEIPDEETAAAIQELREEAEAEADLLKGLPGGSVPPGFFQDPTQALSSDPLFLDQVNPAEFDIPIVVNDMVRKWVVYFTGPGRKYYARWLARSTRFRPLMYEALEARGMPRDLVYLSMIESGYNTSAYSTAAAAGLWQFIPSTGRLYKLRVDWWIDERRDPILSTRAALDFLDELHKMFDGDWELAWASYNTGPGRVRRARIRTGKTSFWEISEAGQLHPETMNYVPKIMAAAIIGKHPERYGFTDIAWQPVYAVDTVHVEGSVDLDVLAKCASLSRAELEELNPALRRWASPPDGVDLRIPAGTREAFVAKLAEVPPTSRVAFVRHRVQKGETLSQIAKKYGVAVGQVTSANRLENANRIYVGMTLVIPTAEGSTGAERARTAAEPRTETPTATPAAKPRVVTHRVRKGDTLSGIASRYAVTTANLKAWNGLKGSTIYVGQSLKVSTPGRSATSTSTASSGHAAPKAAAPKAPSSYTVRSGDTLSTIASAHGVTTANLQRWNNISNAAQIRVGQKLVLGPTSGGGSSHAGSDWTTHTVRSGEYLGGIASRYGVTVAQIKEWNSLRSDNIRAGQTLRIKR